MKLKSTVNGILIVSIGTLVIKRSARCGSALCGNRSIDYLAGAEWAQSKAAQLLEAQGEAAKKGDTDAEDVHDSGGLRR